MCGNYIQSCNTSPPPLWQAHIPLDEMVQGLVVPTLSSRTLPVAVGALGGWVGGRGVLGGVWAGDEGRGPQRCIMQSSVTLNITVFPAPRLPCASVGGGRVEGSAQLSQSAPP